MPNLMREIKDDAAFIRSHRVQPKWYKVLKVFILLGVLAGYYALFGLTKTLVFAAVFIFLSLLLHLLYRAKTHKMTQSWLDFVVVDGKPSRIGPHYYVAIIINALVAGAISQMLV